MGRISIIVAHCNDRGIGFNNAIPWGKNKRDMKHFRDLTNGHTVVMGRKTYDSIGKPLVDRVNIVLTRRTDILYPRPVKIVRHVPAVLKYAQVFPDEEVFIIGGQEVYEQFLPYASRVYVTHIVADFICDTKFPMLPHNEWFQSHFDSFPPDEKSEFPISFSIYERI